MVTILRPMTDDGEPMYLVRVNYRNGLQQEYMYFSAATAKETYETLRTAQKNKLTCEVYDDGGRLAGIDGADVQAVQNVDVGAEVAGAMKMRAIVGGMEAEFAPRPDSRTKTLEEAGYAAPQGHKFAA